MIAKAITTLALAASLGTASVVAEAQATEEASDHGTAVSAVAKSDATTGRAHGEAVSAIAKGDAGKAEEAGGNSGSSMSDIATGFGATISALAKAATGEDRGATISAAAKVHGATVSAAARAK